MAQEPRETVVVDRGNGMGVFIGLALVILLAIAAYFVINQTKNDNARTDAVAGAARDVSDTAKKAGDAIDPEK